MSITNPFRIWKLSTILWILFVVGIACLLVMLGFLLGRLEFFPDGKFEKLGQLGDFFGGVLNPIFGFLAFVGLLTTLFIQNRALSVSMKTLDQDSAVALANDRISRLHAKLSAMSQILEIRRKQADKASSMHNSIVSEKMKSGNLAVSPYDSHFLTMHQYFAFEVEHYSNLIEKILEELGGESAPTAEARRELEKKLYTELENKNPGHFSSFVKAFD